MYELIRIRFRHDLPLVWLLHKPFVPLLLCEANGVLLRLEVHLGALHVVAGRLPAHKRVLPSMAFGEHIPINLPMMRVPVAGLSSGFGGLVNASDSLTRCLGLTILKDTFM